MIVLDASVLIAHLDRSDLHHDRAREVLLHAEGDVLAASLLTLAEVLVAPARAGRLDPAAAALLDLGVRTVPWHADAHRRLAALRASTALQLPDCCVLLAAEQERAPIATFDKRLGAAALEYGVRVVG